MKSLLSLLMLGTAFSAWAADPVTAITLNARNGDGYYIGEASLNLWTMRHSEMADYDSTTVYYEAQPGSPDYESFSFRMNTTVSDVGHIADLGKIACADVPNSYEQKGTYPGKGHGNYPYKEDRKLDPMFWLTYADAYNKLTEKGVSGYARVQDGHCYIVHKVSRKGRIVALLHVKSYVPGKTVELDEIEIFDRSEFKKN